MKQLQPKISCCSGKCVKAGDTDGVAVAALEVLGIADHAEDFEHSLLQVNMEIKGQRGGGGGERKERVRGEGGERERDTESERGRAREKVRGE